MSGELGWTLIDDLHRRVLDSILPNFGLNHLGETERRDLNRVWHRLSAWPDSVAGLTRLKQRFTICSLSNGNIGLLTRMAKRAGLPWDCVLSAEVFRAYKPDPATYLGVAKVFDVPPADVMLVAAHHDDLAQAPAPAACTPPTSSGRWSLVPASPRTCRRRPGNTLHCRDLLALADVLGC